MTSPRVGAPRTISDEQVETIIVKTLEKAPPGETHWSTRDRTGTYWATRSNMADYAMAGALPCPFEATQRLAALPTRLAAIEPKVQEQLINWDYAICDAAMRRHMNAASSSAIRFPYPSSGVG